MPHKIRIGGMSVTTSESTLLATFRGYGDVVAHAIDKDSYGRSTGVGHVEYSSAQAGTDAIAAKHGSVLEGATISVQADSA